MALEMVEPNKLEARLLAGLLQLLGGVPKGEGGSEVWHWGLSIKGYGPQKGGGGERTPGVRTQIEETHPFWADTQRARAGKPRGLGRVMGEGCMINSRCKKGGSRAGKMETTIQKEGGRETEGT